MHASSKTRPFEDGRSTVGRVEGLDRLDYTIARLENKRLSDWSDTAVGYDKDRTTATKHDWNRDALSCILPSLYRYLNNSSPRNSHEFIVNWDKKLTLSLESKATI